MNKPKIIKTVPIVLNKEVIAFVEGCWNKVYSDTIAIHSCPFILKHNLNTDEWTLTFKRGRK